MATVCIGPHRVPVRLRASFVMVVAVGDFVHPPQVRACVPADRRYATTPSTASSVAGSGLSRGVRMNSADTTRPRQATPAATR